MRPVQRRSNTPVKDNPRKETLSVLIVDDEKDLRDSVSELLLARGYQVTTADEGQSALDMLRDGTCKPDVILLDLMMPGMNGWQFRDEQLGDPEIASIPVVVITATRNLREIRADDMLHKPVKPEELVAVVDRWGRRVSGGGVAASIPSAVVAAPPVRPSAASMPVTGNGDVDRTALFSERFVEMLGHDLRNPLSAISITGGLLNFHASTPEIAEPTNRILSIVDRMDLMIGHLLDFLRYCLGRDIPLDRTPTDLSDVCGRVTQTLSRSTGRTITLEASEGNSGLWDKARMEMLVATLVTDAFDRDQSDRPVHVQVSGPSAELVRLEVFHHGISSVDLLSLQMRNDREDIEAECTRLGLGMYVARQIVRAHGGEIRVDASETDGTRFTVDLPRELEAR